MNLYLPIANISVNVLVIVLLGGGVGILSGMFGIGGGFLTTPLLILYGVPPTVAAASAASQVTGASVSGAISYHRRKLVDVRMGSVMVVGGVIGSLIGAWLLRRLQELGQSDTVIAVVYVVLLTAVGWPMVRDGWASMRATARGEAAPARRRRHHPLVASLPWRWRFYGSGLYISPLAPLLLGAVTGMLTVLLGVGGGFIMVPAMLYILGMNARVVVGTSLFQTLFVTAATTLVHSVTTYAVDIVLAGLLLVGSVVGAQVGARFAERARPDALRLALGVIVLLIALRMAYGLGIRPDDIFTAAPL